MSTTTHKRSTKKLRGNARLFAALGDETRLTLISKLGEGRALSISQLCSGASVSRQAITKHLGVLQDVGLVRGKRRGRENIFQLRPKTLDEAREGLAAISRQWDQALASLKAFVEEK